MVPSQSWGKGRFKAVAVVLKAGRASPAPQGVPPGLGFCLASSCWGLGRAFTNGGVIWEGHLSALRPLGVLCGLEIL